MTKTSTNIRWTGWAFVALASLAVSLPASAQTTAPGAKFDDVVREAVAEGRSVRAIVRFRDAASRTRGAATVALRGGRVRRTLDSVGALTVDIDAATAAALAEDTSTVTVSIDAQVQASAITARPSVRSSGANNARQRFNRSGRDISVAVIDSGVRPHHDLPAARIRKFVDFVNGRTTPYDDFGHGTHVAGIVAGSGAASLHLEDPYLGAAPEVDIVALKVLDGRGAGSTSDVIEALEWVAVNHVAYNIRVVNLSLGHPVFEAAATDPLVQAAEALVRRGIVVVASAGNLGINPRNGLPGNGGITSPANGASIIAVGAVDDKATHARSDDSVPGYSSRGPTRFDLLVKPDLVAPGHRVVSLSAPDSYLFDGFPALHVTAGSEAVAQYMMLSGTSMAAPLVSGTAALMLDANPRLTAGTVRAVLEFTAQHLPNTDVLTQGAGSLNALGAVRLAGLIKPRVAVGSIWLKSQKSLPMSYDILAGEQVQWGKHVIWGNRMLLGDSAYLHMAAWDDNIVWGQALDNMVWGQCEGDGCDNVVWGQCEGEGCDDFVWGQCQSNDCDNIVWGQNALDNIVWGQCATDDCDNIVWGQSGDNIVWGQRADDIVWGQCEADDCDNIVWGQDGTLLGYWAAETLWGFWEDAVDWTKVTRQAVDNIVWGQAWLHNIVWGECDGEGCDNIVWGQSVLTEAAR
jgi:serine protease AprX